MIIGHSLKDLGRLTIVTDRNRQIRMRLEVASPDALCRHCRVRRAYHNPHTLGCPPVFGRRRRRGLHFQPLEAMG